MTPNRLTVSSSSGFLRWGHSDPDFLYISNHNWLFPITIFGMLVLVGIFNLPIGAKALCAMLYTIAGKVFSANTAELFMKDIKLSPNGPALALFKIMTPLALRII